MVSVLKMQQSAVSFIMLGLALAAGDESSKAAAPYPNFVNKIYQLTNRMADKPKPWYGFWLFLPNGLFVEANNIAGSNSASWLGVNLTLGVHFGYYTCLQNYMVHLSDTGYMYTTPEVAFFSRNGAVPVHDYYLHLSGEHAKNYHGTVRYAIFRTGSNPFASSNTPVFLSANGTAKCQFIDGRSFQFPTTMG